MTASEPDHGAMGWMVHYARKHYWRIKKANPTLEWSDIIQEGRECYFYTLWKYPKARDRRHIMSLFQLVFRSRVEFLARGRSILKNNSCNPRSAPHQCAGDLGWETELALPDEEMATLCTMIAQAPPMIKAVLELFTTEAGLQALRGEYLVASNGHRETVNERLRKLIGCNDNSVDLVGSVRAYFSA